MIVGKTSMPEMGILPTTEPRRFGPARNPWDTGRTPGRLERRSGRGGGSRDGAGGARQRRRRVDPDPRRLLRAGRPQAGARARLGRTRRRAQLPGLRRRADPHGRRHRAACSTCWPGPSRATPPGPRRRRRPATRRSPRSIPGDLRIALAVDPPLRGRRPSIRSASRRRATRRRCSSRSGTTSRRSRPPWSGSTCCPTSPGRSGRWSRSPPGWGDSIAGREPTADDVEPLTWTLWEHPRPRTRSST